MGPEKAQIGRLSQTVWAKGFCRQPWHWLGFVPARTCLYSVYSECKMQVYHWICNALFGHTFSLLTKIFAAINS